MRLENKEKVWLDISKYHEGEQETYRLVVFKYNQYFEVVYGDNAARVLEIARGKARGNSRYVKGLAKKCRKSLELLKKHRERYGK